MSNVWRINIKTAAIPGVNPREFCLKKNILGVGWRVDNKENITTEEYFEFAKKKYKTSKMGRSWTLAINAIKRMKVNDLCWTRNQSGVYFIGKVTGPWEYRGDKENLEADVVNIRACEWYKVGTVDVVPGRVVNSYVRGNTVQPIKDVNVIEYSKYLFNSLSGTRTYDQDKLKKDILSLISSEDCEDLLGIYLQTKGYIIIPSSCKSDTAGYEYVLKHKDSGEKAVVQVKQGDFNLNIEKYYDITSRYYLFTTKGKYIGENKKNIICIDPEEMRDFALNNYCIMSDRVKNWIDHCNI